MVKITPSTTASEIAALFAQYGVLTMHVEIRYDDQVILPKNSPLEPHPCKVTLQTSQITTIGTGSTTTLAMDDAFSRLWHMLARSLT